MSVFEKFVAKEIPSYIVYEDDLVMAFLDIMQSTKGHTLVIPKKKYENIFEIPEELLKHLIAVTKMLAEKIKIAFNADGINLLNNNGKAAGQTVFHYHFHIIPRYENDNFKVSFENNADKLTKADYEMRLNTIKKHLWNKLL